MLLREIMADQIDSGKPGNKKNKDTENGLGFRGVLTKATSGNSRGKEQGGLSKRTERTTSH